MLTQPEENPPEILDSAILYSYSFTRKELCFLAAVRASPEAAQRAVRADYAVAGNLSFTCA